MKIIAITTPKVVAEDAHIIARLLDMGIDAIHLRKPDSDIGECRRLLCELSAEQRSKIIIHDYPELYDEFSLKGIHINKNVVSLPDDYRGFKSRSCHTFEELTRYKSDYDYLFLSPVFDSISKVGYRSRFSHDELQRAAAEGVIDDKVVALGGVTFDKIPYLESLNFGGVAMLGCLYNVDAFLDKCQNLFATRALLARRDKHRR